MFALNTNWDVFYEPSSQGYFLLNEDHWLTSKSADGPWTVATTLPARLSNLPNDDNWAEVRKHVPAKKSEIAEHVFASKEPAELIVTAGNPDYKPIPQTRLLEITNTESLLMLDSAGGKFYYQAAGRWFRSEKLDGPWSAASSDLPEDFAKIPTTALSPSSKPPSPARMRLRMPCCLPPCHNPPSSIPPRRRPSK